MILEIDDKRELKLDDAVDDDTARQLKKLILAIEARALADKPKADPRFAILEEQVADLKKRLDAALKPKQAKPVKRKKYGSKK